MLFLELFIVYFQIGLFAFGGGYAAMPLIQNLVVEGKQWLTMAEYADLTTIAEMTPGPVRKWQVCPAQLSVRLAVSFLL